MRITEAYQVPEGNVSPDIFALPCVTSAYKTMTQGIRYHADCMIAKPSDWICKDENGEWIVLTDEEYHKFNPSTKLWAANMTKYEKATEAPKG